MPNSHSSSPRSSVQPCAQTCQPCRTTKNFLPCRLLQPPYLVENNMTSAPCVMTKLGPDPRRFITSLGPVGPDPHPCISIQILNLCPTGPWRKRRRSRPRKCRTRSYGRWDFPSRRRRSRQWPGITVVGPAWTIMARTRIFRSLTTRSFSSFPVSMDGKKCYAFWQ